MEMKDIRTVAIDAIKGKMNGKFAEKETSDALRNAFIELNNGSTKISPKEFYRGSALYALVESIIPAIIDEGIKTEENPLFDIVEYKNVKEGDEAVFTVEGDANFVVSVVADGVRDIRRQKIAGGKSITVDTQLMMVRVYEDLSKLMADRIDFDKFVEGVANSFKKEIAQCIYDAINGMTAATEGLDATYVKTGSYDENSLIQLIDHVEAATEKTAKIVGTRAALRKITTAVVADSAKEDMYNLGYYGKFNGTEMFRMKQAHKAGTSTFALSDSKIYIIASDDKPVKVVNEGDGIMLSRDPATNADLTQEYIYGQKFGVGVICGDKIGVYTVG